MFGGWRYRDILLLVRLLPKGNTDLEIFIAEPGTGGNIGEEGEGREEQKEHTRRMRKNVQSGCQVESMPLKQDRCCKQICHSLLKL